MCTIAILAGVLPDAPLVLAANRDELLARPARPPEVLDAARGVVGGLDAAGGGTWLAVRRDGRFAAVTNERALAPPAAGLRSRGLAVRELACADDQDAYVAGLDPRRYASMNLVWGRAGEVRVAHARQPEGRIEVRALAPGVHVLCNGALGAPGFPRGARLAAAIAARLAAPGEATTWRRLAPALQAALADHARAEDGAAEAAPHLPPDLARALTATCVHADGYGTRSASLVALAAGEVLGYLHADGPPCRAPFVEVAAWRAGSAA